MEYENSDSTIFAFSATLARRPSLAPFHVMSNPYDQPLSGPVLAGINRRPSDDPRTCAARAQISPMLLHPHAPAYFQRQPFDSQSALAEVEALYAEFFEPQQSLEPEEGQKQPVINEQQWAQYSFGSQPSAHAFVASSPPPPLDHSTPSPTVEPMPCSPVQSHTFHSGSTRWKMYEPTARTFYTPDSPLVVSGAFSAPSPIAIQPTFEAFPEVTGMNATAVASIAIPASAPRSATPNAINATSPAESLDDEDSKFMQKRVIPSISAYKRLHGRSHKRDLSGTMSVASDEGMASGYSSAGLTPLMKGTLLGAAPPCAVGEKRKRPESDDEGEADGEGEMAYCEEVPNKDVRPTSQFDALQTHYHVFSIHSPQLHLSDSTPIFLQSRPPTRTPDVDSAEDSDAFMSAPHSDNEDDEFKPGSSYFAARGSKKSKNSKTPASRLVKRTRTKSPPNASIIVDYEISDYITPGTTSCPICGHEPSGSRLSDLRRHMQTHKKDGQRRMWACRKCSRVVKDKDGKVVKIVGHTAFVRCDSLKRHWGREHVEE